MKRIALSVLCILACAPAKAETVWVTKPFEGGHCKDVASGDVDKGEDYIVRRCDAFPGVPMWSLYQEGVRLSVGFGHKPHTALRYAQATRGGWPVTWGGEKKAGKLIPKIAIARFTFEGEEPPAQHLMVFRLLENGMSCVVADVAPGPQQNEKARALALASIAKWTCQGEAEPLKF
jgi:hypothetical protein